MYLFEDASGAQKRFLKEWREKRKIGGEDLPERMKRTLQIISP